MSCLPSDIVEEAVAISVEVSSDKSLDMSASTDSPARVKAHKLGIQLVQVARNSLLDIDALRLVTNNYKLMTGVALGRM